ncbi:hypothetical protein [Undibacterium sp. Xuan67W]|uniref:hypothetical protein n=1 Tax=Undibacterium sp. Xuan67W TaxID=3413057 RepID=UPI003BF23EC9
MACLLVLRRFCAMFLLLGLSLTVGLAHADPRAFPSGTKRGVLTASAYPDIVIDGKVRRTQPSTRIYDEVGLLVLPATLPSATLTVNYLANDFGDIERIWILTTEEVKQDISKQIKQN